MSALYELDDVLPLLLFTLPVLLVFRLSDILKRKWQGTKTTIWREVLMILLIGYLACLVGLTLGRKFYTDFSIGNIGKGLGMMNVLPIVKLIPKMKEAFTKFNIHDIIKIFKVLILFLPFGFLAGMVCKGRLIILKVMLYGFLFSLGMEIIKIFCLRAADVNVILFAVLGSLIGVALFYLFRKILPQFFYLFCLRLGNTKLSPKSGVLVTIVLVFQILLWVAFIATGKFWMPLYAKIPH
jgi:glycopeptide antibiotics resistance protein